MLSIKNLARYLLNKSTAAICGSAVVFSCSVCHAQPLDLKLFSIRNGESVQLSQLPAKLTLVNFWRSDCPPCIKELPMLLETTNTLGIRLITISVQTLTETKSFWKTVPGSPDSHVALLAPSNPNGLLRRFGNKIGAIPHSVLLNQQNEVCSKHTGEITEQWITESFLKCQ